MADFREPESHPDGTSSLEKGAVHDYVDHHADDRYHFNSADLDRVQRKLKQRHVQMIAVSSPFHISHSHNGHRAPATPVPSLAYFSLCAQLR